MKTLFLVRHAKSSRDDPSLPDRERPLNARGLHDAPAMGKRLAKRRVQPDLMVSSPATRAWTTAQLIAAEIGYEVKAIVVDERLYAARVENLLAFVRALDSDADSVMLFGHNPEFSELAARLSGQNVDMSTCAVAEISFDAKSWSDVGTVEAARCTLDKPHK
jgi:phosphohistidine phosphatase